jgi:hypothetical protein
VLGPVLCCTELFDAKRMPNLRQEPAGSHPYIDDVALEQFFFSY